MSHVHEKIDYTGDVFIVNGDAVLLRMHDKYEVWLPPGGHVELDEDMVEAALREAREETGLEVRLVGKAPDAADSSEKELLVPRFINRHRIDEIHEHISFVYFATSNNRDVAPYEGEKADGFHWFSKEELEDPACAVGERTRRYALEALRAVGTELAS